MLLRKSPRRTEICLSAFYCKKSGFSVIPAVLSAICHRSAFGQKGFRKCGFRLFRYIFVVCFDRSVSVSVACLGIACKAEPRNGEPQWSGLATSFRVQ